MEYVKYSAPDDWWSAFCKWSDKWREALQDYETIADLQQPYRQVLHPADTQPPHPQNHHHHNHLPTQQGIVFWVLVLTWVQC